MTAERWRRLEALFHRASTLPAGDRNGFVARETADDPGLGVELEEMLAAAARAPECIAEVVRSVAARAAAAGDLAGRRMGPYRLVREVGRGGMGLVFEACRDDDEYRKTVALKIAPEWRDTNGFGGRFRSERQILAGLEHPNIARFLDGGSEGGVPYFAMEYVDGRPITDYCRDHGLSLRARITLFRQVCDAVHYAHENLVVHRDLKPANILVGRDGVPKLLDFGIAKLLGPIRDAEGATSGMRMWTPDYTSPEQVRGGPVTTRTDVYSLGLILYEVLCGQRAQCADTSSPLALDRSICETGPPPASERAAAGGDRAVSRQLRGDLDTIVAMAIRKEPERRYSSAAALSQDLGRYLEGKPVEARPGTVAYRAWKSVRRHRAAVAAAVLVAASIAGGVVATLVQARRAERRYQQVRGLANSVLFGVHDRIQHLAGATEAREWAVTTALAYLDKLAPEAGGDPSLEYELATAYLKVGDVQGYPLGPNLGQPQAANDSYHKALALAQRLPGGDRDPKVRRLVAQAHHRIGGMLRVFQKAAAGVDEFHHGLEIEEAVYRTNPGNPEDAELMVVLLSALGQAEAGLGRVADANRSFARVLEVATRWNQENPSDDARSKLASGHYVVSRGLQNVGDLEGSEKHARAGLEIDQELAARHPADAVYRRNVMNSYLQLAYVYWQPSYLSLGDRNAAAPLAEKAVEIARGLTAADANNATAQFDLMIAESDYCSSLSLAHPRQAIGHCQEALAIAGRWPQLSADTALVPLAEALQALGREKEAIAAMRRALKVREGFVERDPGRYSHRQQLQRERRQMGELLLASGDREGALAAERQALADAEALTSEQPQNLVSRRDLADTYESLGRIDRAQARAWYAKSLDIWSVWSPSTRMDQSRRERVARASTHLNFRAADFER